MTRLSVIAATRREAVRLAVERGYAWARVVRPVGPCADAPDLTEYVVEVPSAVPVRRAS